MTPAATKRRTLGLVAVVAVAGVVCAADPSPLAPLDFLVGEWQGAGSGAPGESTGAFTFARHLQGRVLVRTNYADYPAANGRPAFRHDDLMVVYAGASGAIRADYWDNEGHVLHYLVATREGEAVFTTEPSPAAPRFRLTYKRAASGALDGSFETAPPGKPDAFAPYLSWTARPRGKKGP